MPCYVFEHPKTGEQKEIIQSVKDKHSYVDEEGVKWNRVWFVPNASIDSQLDVNNPRQFVEKTRDQKGTMGDLFDQAKEASEKREQKLGYDPVKKKYYEEWSKKRGGKKHPNSHKD
jgi:hypothetical protein